MASPESTPEREPGGRDAGSIVPATNERVTFIGSTRSGKTTLACSYLGRVKRTPVILVDTKGDGTLNRFADAHGYYRSSKLVIPSERYPRVIIQGPPDGEWWDPLFWASLRMENGCVVYIDELTHLTSSHRTEPGLKSAFATGGGRGIGVWASTQRPAGVSIAAMSEADHLFAFRVGFPDDEDTVGRLIRFGKRRFDSNSLPKYGFAYHTHGLQIPIIGRAITPIV